MDQIFATAFHGLFVYLGVALALLVLLGVLRSPRFKGWRGERAVRSTIRQKLNPLVYVDVHDVALPTVDGSTTQIDHLIFSPYGLFVLETKNYQGWIFGTEKQRDWTQQIFKKRSKFQNPLRQNYKHIKTLQVLLDMPAEHLHSVIAFVGDCEFKTEMPPQVSQGGGFVDYIQSFEKAVWSPEQMQALLDRLEEVRLQPGRATDRQHVINVKALKSAQAACKTKPLVHLGRAPAAGIKPEVSDDPGKHEAPTALTQSPVTSSIVSDISVCPQCEWPLRKLLMQRGPLAGQGVWRCTNTAGCNFVRADM